jgi:hypothetical protein
LAAIIPEKIAKILIDSKFRIFEFLKVHPQMRNYLCLNFKRI